VDKHVRCVSCVFFQPLLHSDVKEGDQIRLGKCRKNAPTVAGFPQVLPYEFCGEHRLDAEKLGVSDVD
jgi:hypothetical protein